MQSSLFKIFAIFLLLAFPFTTKAEVITIQNVTATVQPVGGGVFQIAVQKVEKCHAEFISASKILAKNKLLDSETNSE